MIWLLLGLLIFFGIHFVPILTSLRAQLASSIGAVGYQAVFSIISLVGFVLIVMGYGEMQTAGSGNPQIWLPPTWIKHVVFLLMLPVFVFLIAAYVPSNIRDRVKHPMLIAIKIWALAHLLANGDLASIIMFGSFLAYAVIDRISVKSRVSRGPLGERKGTIVGDVVAVVGGLGVYLLFMFWAHEQLIGIALIP